jgi:hypothetical protein
MRSPDMQRINLFPGSAMTMCADFTFGCVHTAGFLGVAVLPPKGSARYSKRRSAWLRFAAGSKSLRLSYPAPIRFVGVLFAYLTHGSIAHPRPFADDVTGAPIERSFPGQ